MFSEFSRNSGSLLAEKYSTPETSPQTIRSLQGNRSVGLISKGSVKAEQPNTVNVALEPQEPPRALLACLRPCLKITQQQTRPAYWWVEEPCGTLDPGIGFVLGTLKACLNRALYPESMPQPGIVRSAFGSPW